MSTNTKKASEPPIQPKTLLAGAASAFVVGLAGSIWQANRKHAKEMQAEAAASATAAHVAAETSVSATTATTTAKPTPVGSPMHTPSPQPVMTPAEYAKSRADARHFALRSFGYGTLAAFGGMGVLALLTAWWMDVSSVSEPCEVVKPVLKIEPLEILLFIFGINRLRSCHKSCKIPFRDARQRYEQRYCAKKRSRMSFPCCLISIEPNQKKILVQSSGGRT